MDAIEALDYGVYAHFAHMSKQPPDLTQFMQPAAYLSSYVAITILMLIAIALFLRRGKRQPALVTALTFLGAVILIQVVRVIVPRPGPTGAVGSYPSAGVFLFTLSAMLLSKAIWQLAERGWQRAAIVTAAVVLTVWVCFGELFLSTRWLTDILGGLAGATLLGWAAIRLMDTGTSKPDDFS